MIDTDKYEGHTPAPWKWIIDDKDTYLSCFDNDIKADENLIADAPLLLAIVKQVQELAREATDPNGQGGKGGDTMRKIARIVGVIE